MSTVDYLKENIVLFFELIDEQNEASMTIPDPRFIPYLRFVDEKHYLRFYPVEPVHIGSAMDWNEIADMMIGWCLENVEGRFSCRNWSVFNFELRRDALLFKLAWG